MEIFRNKGEIKQRIQTTHYFMGNLIIDIGRFRGIHRQLYEKNPERLDAYSPTHII